MKQRRIIVCGGRDYTDRNQVRRVLATLADDSGPRPVIVHGNYRGLDRLAGFEADKMGFPVEPHDADWGTYGGAAGPIRNGEMLDAGAHLVIAFPGGHGTADMVKQARTRGVPVRGVPPTTTKDTPNDG